MINKDMNKYQNGKIYKIVDVGYNKCYIGSTCESLSKRMAKHRYTYSNYLKGKKGATIRSFILFDEYGIDNCKIELIENFPCLNKDELRKREGNFIKETDCLNKQVAGRTKEEYRTEFKEFLDEKIKEWNETHKEHRRNYEKQYREENVEHKKEYARKYNEEHKEHIKEMKQELYNKHREELLQKFECECGARVAKQGLNRHLKTKKHQDFINNQ